MSIIKSIAVGNGDMFYIKHGSSNFTIIDCNMDEENKKEITDEIIVESEGKILSVLYLHIQMKIMFMN